MNTRDATAADFRRINEIYNWTVVDNHISFEVEPWDLAARKAWANERPDELTCLVAEVDSTVVGVTYSSYYRPKAAYRSSLETTIVLDQAFRSRGIGSALLSALLERLRLQGTHRAIAVVAEPNDASLALHRRLGYLDIGTLSEVGYKQGRYIDTTIMEKRL